MRSPGRRRPLRRLRSPSLPQSERLRLAEQVSYLPSPEHKDHLTTAGVRRLRSDATVCPRHPPLDVVEQWLKQAVLVGDFSALAEGEFPRYVWAERDGHVFEARLTNSGLGQYKGYPLDDAERPPWL